MPKLINQLYPKDELYDEACFEEGEVNITYEPVVNDKTGKVELVLEVCTCVDCGESWVTEVFTEGSMQSELIARELGFRDECDEDYFYFGEEE